MNFFKRKFYQIYLSYLKVFSSDDVEISKVQYFLKTGNKLNLDNPVTFADKLQWLKLYYYDESFGRYADKYLSRKIVRDIVGSDVLVDLIATYESVDAIDFEKLPNQFVLKCTHGSGFNLIVKDKSTLNIEKEKCKLKKFMLKNYYYRFREKIYKNLTPKIIVEAYLEQEDSCGIIDYKFQCFDGKPENVLVKKKVDGFCKKALYNMNWERHEPDSDCGNYLKCDLQKPLNFEEMKEVAAKLSKGFPFLRVDLYSVKGKTYFGELTFIPNGGAKDTLIKKLDLRYGNLIQLP